MFPSEVSRACHSSIKVMQKSDQTIPHPSLFAKAEKVDHQVPDFEDSFSPLVKEPHTQPCLLETVTVDAIASNEKQVRALAASVEDLEIHVSEACHKSYVVFDQCAGQKSLLCHPTLLNSHPHLIPSVFKNANDLFPCLQDISDKAAENILNTCPLSNPSAWGTRLLAYRESMEAAFTALELVKVNGFYCTGFKSGGHGLMASLNPVEDIQNKSRVCGYCVPYDQGEGIESPLHEDTDDIDALMSTEEELSSTCHTLSELNVDNSSMPTDDGDDQSSSNARKRRRIQKSDVEEVADREFVHSNAESSQKIMSRKKHVWKGTFQDKRGKYEQNTEFLEDAWFVKRAKLIKVKDTFEELKNVIPGGDCLDDTASVLEKAVYYIKSLKAKLQKLDTSNEILVNVH